MGRLRARNLRTSAVLRARRPFRWGLLNALRARRHIYAKYIWDTTDHKRRRWVDLQAKRLGSREFRLDRADLPDRFSFAIFGDTGEGDESQHVVAERLAKACHDTSFAIIASDVIYPVGRSKYYRERFYAPYADYRPDIYAVPGNHDWYDDAVGFMVHFCDTNRHFRGEGPAVEPAYLETLRDIRRNKVFQPNLYFFIETRCVRIVCLDTGIRGQLDGEQLMWLREVSRTEKRKILVLGHPIYADGRYRRSLAEVDAIAKDEEYDLVVSGDTHNFQRYRIPREGDRVTWHVVAGGGGAYLSRTQRIPLAGRMKLPVRLQYEPEDFTCYPSREASRLREHGWRRWIPIDSWADRDEPPFWRSLLRVDVAPEGLRLSVYGVIDYWDREIQKGPVLRWDIA